MKYNSNPFLILISLFLAETVTADVLSYLHIPTDGLECILLRESGVNATRDGNLLKIRTAKGERTFEDRIDVGDGSAKYRLIGLLQGFGHSFALVRVSLHEGNGYELVDQETGKTIFLYNIPRFSEDWSRFVDVSLDLEAGYMPNVIRIFKLEDSGYAKEWEHFFRDGGIGPTDPVWLNSAAIVFFESAYEGDPGGSEIIRKPFIIELKNGKWNEAKPLK